MADLTPTSHQGVELSKRSPSQDGVIRRSMHAMSDLFSPFSSTALASLPRNPRGRRDRAPRMDRIPNTNGDEVFRDYNAINSNGGLPPLVRVPKKIATPIKVEAKVWFANERTWISYLNVSILLGTLALALFNASHDIIARRFAYAYATISVGTMIYGYIVYQKRITMIRRRDPGNFDELVGPLVICLLLFFAILSNFIIRMNELRQIP